VRCEGAQSAVAFQSASAHTPAPPATDARGSCACRRRRRRRRSCGLGRCSRVNVVVTRALVATHPRTRPEQYVGRHHDRHRRRRWNRAEVLRCRGPLECLSTRRARASRHAHAAVAASSGSQERWWHTYVCLQLLPHAAHVDKSNPSQTLCASEAPVLHADASHLTMPCGLLQRAS